MAITNPAPNNPAPKSFSFNETAFEKRVTELKAVRDSEAGKPNKNPFIWYRDNVQSLVDLYNKGTRTEELYNKLMAVSNTVPDLKKGL